MRDAARGQRHDIVISARNQNEQTQSLACPHPVPLKLPTPTLKTRTQNPYPVARPKSQNRRDERLWGRRARAIHVKGKIFHDKNNPCTYLKNNMLKDVVVPPIITRQRRAAVTQNSVLVMFLVSAAAEPDESTRGPDPHLVMLLSWRLEVQGSNLYQGWGYLHSTDLGKLT